MSSHRITFVLTGYVDAVKRSVRRMLDNHGFTEVSFDVGPEMVLVHADGGTCHGTPLVDGRCPACGIVPDMQSTEMWPRATVSLDARTPTLPRRHAPVLSKDLSRVIGCRCGWRPSGTPGSDAETELAEHHASCR